MFVPIALALAVLLGSGMYLSYRKDRNWNQDEAVAFLESTCHLHEFMQLTYDRVPPYGAWAEARTWQRLIEGEGELCLGRIRSDLLDRDIHPPLYYWLLHLWILGNGGRYTFMATFGLNLLLAAVAALALYKLGRTLFASRLDGLAVAFCAALNPIAAYATVEFRPYALLGPATAVYLLALVRAVPSALTRRRTVLRGTALALATAAGLLSHHLFGVVLIGGAAFAVAQLWRRPRELLRVGAFSVAGVALALAIFPLITQITSNPWAIEPAASRFPLREKRLVKAFWNLVPRFGEQHVILAVAVALIVLLLGIAWKDWPPGGFRRTRGLAIALVVLIVPTAIALQYGLGFSPAHAMTPKYLASVWPAVGLFAVLVFRLFGRHRFAIALGCGVLLSAATVSRIDDRWDKLFDDARIVKRHKTLVIDSLSRTHLPMILPRIKPDTQVFIASQEHLLEHDAWRTNEDFTFVTCTRDRASRKSSSRLVRAFSETHAAGPSVRWDSCWYTQPFEARRR